MFLIPLSSFEKRNPSEHGVLDFVDTRLNNQQQQSDEAHGLELFIVVAKHRGVGFYLGQLVQLVVQLFLGPTIVLYMDIGTTSGHSHLTAHLLVEACHHGLSCCVFHIVAVAYGDGGSLGRSHTQHIHSHASFLRIAGCLQRSTFMVFTVGNHNDGLAYAFFLRKAVRCHIDGLGDICTLHVDERGFYA